MLNSMMIESKTLKMKNTRRTSLKLERETLSCKLLLKFSRLHKIFTKTLFQMLYIILTLLLILEFMVEDLPLKVISITALRSLKFWFMIPQIHTIGNRGQQLMHIRLDGQSPTWMLTRMRIS